MGELLLRRGPEREKKKKKKEEKNGNKGSIFACLPCRRCKGKKKKERRREGFRFDENFLFTTVRKEEKKKGRGRKKGKQ